MSIFNNSNHFKLFVVFELIIILICLFCFLINNKTYRSDLIEITPDISTPAPVGQKQFGSARWMKEHEKSKVFKLVHINPNDELIKELINTGYDDLEVIDNYKLKEGGVESADDNE